MRIGIVSDTHGEAWTTQQAVRMFDSLRVGSVIHCGDIGTAEIVRLLSRWPCHFVLGNMDDATTLREAISLAGQTCYERFGHLKIQGRSVAFLHGDDGTLLRQTIHSGQWDLVCHGHTHVAANFSLGQTLIVNPGAIQRTGCPSVAVIDLPSLKVTHVPL
ncbi:MAG: metallophosphoesterase family protein [Pirellulales bacterium]|nr:metallophosphoesterase family protein [Pirellulales bacterium]